MTHQVDGKPGKITDRAEEYLEAILNMSVEGQEAYAAKLAARLAVSAPTVSAALGRLKRDGLIATDSRKRISLTRTGREAATAIVRRHRLVERLLTDYLGVAWSDCHKEACLLEHAISARVEEQMYERLGRPETCPHGNPIPKGLSIKMPECQELTSITEGTTVRIIRITEEVSDDHRMMEFLQSSRLTPGQRFVVRNVSPEGGTITLGPVEDGASELTIATNVAASLFVKPV